MNEDGMTQLGLGLLLVKCGVPVDTAAVLAFTTSKSMGGNTLVSRLREQAV